MGPACSVRPPAHESRHASHYGRTSSWRTSRSSPRVSGPHSNGPDRRGLERERDRNVALSRWVSEAAAPRPSELSSATISFGPALSSPEKRSHRGEEREEEAEGSAARVLPGFRAAWCTQVSRIAAFPLRSPAFQEVVARRSL